MNFNNYGIFILKILHGPNNITNTPRKIADLERRKGHLSDSINTKIVMPDGPSHFNSKDNLVSKILFRFNFLRLPRWVREAKNQPGGACWGSLAPPHFFLNSPYFHYK